VVALSVDSEEDAQKMVDHHTLTFPVLYGLNAREIMATIGGYINEEPLFLHPSGFILRPNGTIVLLVNGGYPENNPALSKASKVEGRRGQDRVADGLGAELDEAFTR
jgi:peroxiredoxin